MFQGFQRVLFSGWEIGGLALILGFEGYQGYRGHLWTQLKSDHQGFLASAEWGE